MRVCNEKKETREMKVGRRITVGEQARKLGTRGGDVVIFGVENEDVVHLPGRQVPVGLWAARFVQSLRRRKPAVCLWPGP
jgi:hypothetical protein